MLSRCDVKEMSKVVVVFSIIAWLEALKENPVDSDIVLVTGSDKGRVRLISLSAFFSLGANFSIFSLGNFSLF